MSVGLRGDLKENDFFMQVSDRLGFDSAASLARGALYALLERHPLAEEVRNALGINPPEDDETIAETKKGRELLEAVSVNRRKISVSART